MAGYPTLAVYARLRRRGGGVPAGGNSCHEPACALLVRGLAQVPVYVRLTIDIRECAVVTFVPRSKRHRDRAERGSAAVVVDIRTRCGLLCGQRCNNRLTAAACSMRVDDQIAISSRYRSQNGKPQQGKARTQPSPRVILRVPGPLVRERISTFTLDLDGSADVD